MSRTLEQKRAQCELQFIQSMRENHPANDVMPTIDNKFREKLNTLIQKAPVQIMQNGLGQMLAFLLADNEGKNGNGREASGILYDHLEEWLCGTIDSTHPCRVYDVNDLIGQLTGGDRRQYIQARQETLSLLSWTKKFAAAWLAG